MKAWKPSWASDRHAGPAADRCLSLRDRAIRSAKKEFARPGGGRGGTHPPPLSSTTPKEVRPSGDASKPETSRMCWIAPGRSFGRGKRPKPPRYGRSHRCGKSPRASAAWREVRAARHGGRDRDRIPIAKGGTITTFGHAAPRGPLPDQGRGAIEPRSPLCATILRAGRATGLIRGNRNPGRRSERASLSARPSPGSCRRPHRGAGHRIRGAPCRCRPGASAGRC